MPVAGLVAARGESADGAEVAAGGHAWTSRACGLTRWRHFGVPGAGRSLEIHLECNKVKAALSGLEVHEQVDVAVGGGITARYRTEDPDVGHPSLLGQAQDLIAMLTQQRQGRCRTAGLPGSADHRTMVGVPADPEPLLSGSGRATLERSLGKIARQGLTASSVRSVVAQRSAWDSLQAGVVGFDPIVSAEQKCCSGRYDTCAINVKIMPLWHIRFRAGRFIGVRRPVRLMRYGPSWTAGSAQRRRR